ncbi:MAG: protein kinase [Myxococcota bacterium]
METVGDYELLTRIGAGGMAETFVAIRRGPGGFEQRVCLKRVLPHLVGDKNLTRLFVDEARISATLRHGNIAQVLDFGHDGQSHYLVLELIEGIDLRKLMRSLASKNESLTTGLVVHVAQELAAALEYAHGQGLVHRDISPSNILVSRAGELKLTDFGIAKALGNTGFARTGVVKGKVPYMAPEYAREGRFDPRSDLFALGVSLYEIVGGRRPFDGKSDPETIENLTLGTRPALAELSPDTNQELIHIIERCLEPAPEDRFASARALRDALAELSPPPTARRILGKLVKGAGDTSDAALVATQAGTPKGTAVLTRGTAEAPVEPTPADASDVTRTRGRPLDPPTALDARAPNTQVEGAPQTQLDAAPKTQVEGAPKTQLDAAPKTQLDAAPKTQLDPAPKTQLDPKADGPMQRDVTTAITPRAQATPPWVWIALGVGVAAIAAMVVLFAI